jgi:hypothetical protein
MPYDFQVAEISTRIEVSIYEMSAPIGVAAQQKYFEFFMFFTVKSASKPHILP